MKYIDVNIFVSAITGDDQARLVLTQIASGKLKAATSVLSWDELTWSLRKYLTRDEIFSEGRRFLLFPNLTFVAADQSIVGYAQELMEKYNLDPRDALHAASALNNDITEMISDDEHFEKVKELNRISLKEIK